jgi:hypothetical protein
MSSHLRDIDTALTNVTSLVDFARSMNGLLPYTDAASHRLVKIEPIPDTDWVETHTDLISDYISRRVFERVELYQTITLSESISGLLLDPDARGHAGRLFEQAAHHEFMKGATFKPSRQTKKGPSLTITISEADPKVVHYFYTLSVRAGKGSPNVDVKYFGQYLIPISKTQQSIDALLICRKFTILFQMTVSPKKHGIKFQGIADVLKDLPANAKRDVRIVFVLPAGDKEKDFGRQDITHIPQGASREQIALFESFPQYVYRLSFKR